MSPIKVKVEGSVESAIRQFKRRCIDSGLFAEIKRVAFYEKPSEIRRRDQAKRNKTISRVRSGHKPDMVEKRGRSRAGSKDRTGKKR